MKIILATLFRGFLRDFKNDKCCRHTANISYIKQENKTFCYQYLLLTLKKYWMKGQQFKIQIQLLF